MGQLTVGLTGGVVAAATSAVPMPAANTRDAPRAKRRFVPCIIRVPPKTVYGDICRRAWWREMLEVS